MPFSATTYNQSACSPGHSLLPMSTISSQPNTALQPVSRGLSVQRGLEKLLIYLGLLVGVVLTGAPYLYMITGSFKTNAEIFSYPLHFFPEAPTLVNYSRLLSGGEIPYVQQFGNSVVVSLSQTAY